MKRLQWEAKKRPREASTSGAMADTCIGGIDMTDSTCRLDDCERNAHSRGWCQTHYGRWFRNGDPRTTHKVSPNASILERIIDRVEVGDCWVWQGASSGGYGRIGFEGKVHVTHRFVWEQLVGPVPDGLELDHLCRVRLCVNPDHLEPVTRAENIRRGFSVSARNAKAEECVNGHPFDEKNTYYSPDGRRSCRACRNMHEKRRRGRLRAERAL